MNHRIVQKAMHNNGLKWALVLGWAVGVGVHGLSAAGARAQQIRAERIVLEADAGLEGDAEAVEEDFNLPPEVVNQWIFGGNLQPDDGRKRLEQQLQVRLEELTDHCQLTSEQVSKLRRAGRGDVTRFLRKVGEVQQLVTGKKTNLDMAKLINDHVQPLQFTLQSSSFGDESLFHKTTFRTLDSDQQTRYRELTEERRRAAYRARVELAVALLERQIPLLDQQRNELVDLVLASTSPPLVRRSDVDLLWIHYQISQLPQDKLNGIFREPQRRMLAVHFQRMRDNRPLLMERGLLNDLDE